MDYLNYLLATIFVFADVRFTLFVLIHHDIHNPLSTPLFSISPLAVLSCVSTLPFPSASVYPGMFHVHPGSFRLSLFNICIFISILGYRVISCQ